MSDHEMTEERLAELRGMRTGMHGARAVMDAVTEIDHLRAELAASRAEVERYRNACLFITKYAYDGATRGDLFNAAQQALNLEPA